MKRLFERIPRVCNRRFGKPDASLSEFLEWWANNGSPIMQSPVEGITFIGNGPALVLFREPPFQVQMFLCLPSTNIPKHSHPYVESYEINVSGEVHFCIEGQDVFPSRIVGEEKRDKSGVSRLWGYASHIGAGVSHSASIGKKGGAFISVQKWLNGVAPSSVDEDWEGKPMTIAHMQMLEHQFVSNLSDEAKDSYYRNADI